MKLNKLVNIRAGYSARTRLRQSGPGAIKVINPSDISSWHPVDFSKLQTVAIEPGKMENHSLKSGDLLFFGRSGQIYSVLLENVPDRVIAAGSFLVLTVNPGQKRLLPQYLNWFLNSKHAASYFQTITGESPQRVVTKTALMELDIPLPAVTVQDQIVKTWDLLLAEKELTMERLRIREEIVSNAIEGAIEGSGQDAK